MISVEFLSCISAEPLTCCSLIVVWRTCRRRISVRLRRTGVQTEFGQVLPSTTFLTVWLKCVLALGNHWRGSYLAAAPPLPLVSSPLSPLYTARWQRYHSPPLYGSCSKCVRFFFYPLLFNIIFLSPVLVHNHISSSIDRLFCLIFHCHCICAMSGFLILWYGCRDQSVMLPVSESERAHLLFGCYLFVTNAKTHTRTPLHTCTMQAPHALSFPHYHSHITHSLFSCSDTLPFPLTRAFCQFLGSAAVICCCHLTCHTKCANPYA